MHDATRDAGFGCHDLTVFCRLDELGLVVTGQRLDDPVRDVLACWVIDPDDGATAAAAKASPRHRGQTAASGKA